MQQAVVTAHVQERGFLWPPVWLVPQPLFYPVAHSVSPSPALHALDDAPDGGEGRGEGRGKEEERGMRDVEGKKEDGENVGRNEVEGRRKG